jgi:predicted nucleotidyltransferase
MDILTKHYNEVEEFCKTNRIKKLSLFGSYLNNSYSENSDVDLLVEFENITYYGLLDIARMERELTNILGVKVDLRTPEELSKYFRDSIIKEAEVKYEARG